MALDAVSVHGNGERRVIKDREQTVDGRRSVARLALSLASGRPRPPSEALLTESPPSLFVLAVFLFLSRARMQHTGPSEALLTKFPPSLFALARSPV